MNKIQSGVNRSSYWVPILGSAMRILDVFYEADADLTLHEISAKAKVGKTSAFRILFTLDNVGYVEKDPSQRKIPPRIGNHRGGAQDTCRQGSGAGCPPASKETARRV